MNLGISWAKIYQDAQDIYGRSLDETTMLRRANRFLDTLKGTTNLPTQIRVAFIPYALDFERYALPDDYKTEGVVSLRYDERLDNNLNRTYTREEPPFQDTDKNWRFYTPKIWNERNKINQATIYTDKGKEALWLANGRSPLASQEVDSCDAKTGWTAANGAGNLTVDSDVKVEGDASLNFDLTSATAATLTLILPTAIDLSEYIENGIMPFYLYLPTSPASIDIEIGETSSKYYSQNITAQSDSLVFQTSGINEVKLSFKDASLTGTPDMSGVTHFKITLNFDSAVTDTDFRIDGIKAFKAENLLFEYYSFYMVQISSVWQESLTETAGTTQTVNILPEWREVFAKKIILEELDKGGDKRLKKITIDTDNWLKDIQRRYPSKSIRVGSNWM